MVTRTRHYPGAGYLVMRRDLSFCIFNDAMRCLLKWASCWIFLSRFHYGDVPQSINEEFDGPGLCERANGGVVDAGPLLSSVLGRLPYVAVRVISGCGFYARLFHSSRSWRLLVANDRPELQGYLALDPLGLILLYV